MLTELMTIQGGVKSDTSKKERLTPSLKVLPSILFSQKDLNAQTLQSGNHTKSSSLDKDSCNTTV